MSKSKKSKDSLNSDHALPVDPSQQLAAAGSKETNGQDKHYMREYKGHVIHDAGTPDEASIYSEPRKVTISKDGTQLHSFIVDASEVFWMNRAIEDAKQWVDGDVPAPVNPGDTIQHDDPFQEVSTDTVNPGAPVRYREGDLEILKIILRNDMFLSLVYLRCHDENTVRNPRHEELNWPVHSDLLAKFDALIPHLLFVTEIIDDKKIKAKNDTLEEFEHPLLKHFAVTSVELDGDRDGIKLTGHRKLRGKRIFPMNPPVIKFQGTGKYEYRFGDDAELCWKDLEFEVWQYLNGVKRGKRNNPELPAPVGKAEDAPYVEDAM